VTIGEFLAARRGNAMDIPANQRYVPYLFERLQVGMPTLTRAQWLA
jgi:hypothetical protein